MRVSRQKPGLALWNKGRTFPHPDIGCHLGQLCSVLLIAYVIILSTNNVGIEKKVGENLLKNNLTS